LPTWIWCCDCSDNLLTRQAVNAGVRIPEKALVSGAAIRLEGQLSVFDPRLAGQSPATNVSKRGSMVVKGGALKAWQRGRCDRSGWWGWWAVFAGTEGLKLLAGFGEPAVRPPAVD